MANIPKRIGGRQDGCSGKWRDMFGGKGVDKYGRT
jgi:hypothetical protein